MTNYIILMLVNGQSLPLILTNNWGFRTNILNISLDRNFPYIYDIVMGICPVSWYLNMEGLFLTSLTLVDPGAPPAPSTPPPTPTMGPNLFVSTYISAKKHLRQRSMPLNTSAPLQREILDPPLS